ncbi:hybrid sensor histidine kinase/response regulator [Chitinophaga defluvii]|uniref:histidine kinase n=1 Tax=Chitinophaga defluvii TaxID=3163343 RepID=A0ABV2T0Z2_9BACT
MVAQLLNDRAFLNYNSNNGLSQNTVNAILQDAQGFMWFGTKDGLNRFDGHQFKIINKAQGSLNVTALLEMEPGILWLGTSQGVYTYNTRNEQLERLKLQTAEGIPADGNISQLVKLDSAVFVASDTRGLLKYTIGNRQLEQIKVPWPGITSIVFSRGIYWIAFYNDNLYYSTDGFKTIVPFSAADGQQPFLKQTINKLLPLKNGSLLVGASSGGLKELQPLTRLVNPLLVKDKDRADVYVRELTAIDDEIWVGTESGIYIYDITRSTITSHIDREQGNPFSLADNAIYSIYKDREGSIWVGSYFGGINYLPRRNLPFEKIFSQRSRFSAFGERVRELIQSNDSIIWIGTEDKGLFRFNRFSNEIKPVHNAFTSHNVHGLCLDNDYLWVGTFSQGISRLNLKTGNILSYLPFDPELKDVFAICRTKTGQLLVGASGGLYTYDPVKDRFLRDHSFPQVLIFDIKEDHTGALWAATYGNGVFYKPVGDEKWQQFRFDETEKNSIPDNKVISIYEDNAKRLWFTTEAGIVRYLPQQHVFLRIDAREQGFSGNVIYRMMEDNSGTFWLSSNRGLMQWNVDKKTTRIFNVADGLLNNQFNYKSGLKTADGRLYFGCISGLITFHPQEMNTNPATPPLALTDFRVFNTTVVPGMANAPIKESILTAREVVLKHDQNSFTIKAAVLSFLSSSNNKLIYRLENYDTRWYEAAGDVAINYSNLPYGSYVLTIKGANSNGVWNKQNRVLKITILPPFYRSSIAYMLYVLLLAAIGYYIYRLIKRNISRKNALRVEQLMHQKEKDLYAAKIDFFTNVAHEIRTPLTLIKAPLDVLSANRKIEDAAAGELSLINANTNRLLHLTNQLLDFRRIDSGKYELQYTFSDLRNILEDVYRLFGPLATQKGIALSAQLPETAITGYWDYDALYKIVSNLLSNALKFAATSATLTCTWEPKENGVAIAVSNDGPQVPADSRQTIFEPFVQIAGSRHPVGSGIGLSLSRSLAELHGGTLTIKEDTRHCIFELNLPVQTTGPGTTTTNISGLPVIAPVVTAEAPLELSVVFKSSYTILIVEDNLALKQFMYDQLSSSFIVKTAGNGKEALCLLEQSIIHLVISDIMMPEMDGLELCTCIKDNIITSHIPVVLLTAKTDLETHLKGLAQDADYYIEKPFSIAVLMATVQNILRRKEKLAAFYQDTTAPLLASPEISPADALFLNTLTEHINTHLDQAGFNVEQLALLMNMSKSSLYRKIKGMMEISPNDYIRVTRLKKAALLLKTKQYQVNEVCYMTGFSSPSYFAKCFYEEFGKLPKDYTG